MNSCHPQLKELLLCNRGQVSPPYGYVGSSQHDLRSSKQQMHTGGKTLQAPPTSGSQSPLCMMLAKRERFSPWGTMVKRDSRDVSEEQHYYSHGQQTQAAYGRTSTAAPARSCRSTGSPHLQQTGKYREVVLASQELMEK